MRVRRHPSRRDLLAGLGAVAAMPLLPRVSFAQSLPTDIDVAIVGAGSAGLNAARTLMAAGKSVVVLEAMNRPGGRAYTESDTLGLPFDWGCAWIHSADRNPYLPLAKEWGFTLAQHHDSVDRIYFGDRRFSDGEMLRMKRAYNEIVDANAKAARSRDGAVSSVRAIRTPEEQAAASYIGPMDMAVDLDELAIRDYDEQAELEPNYLVREGFGSVVRRLADGVPVSLETPVRRVRYDGPGVVVETDNGNVSARACIVTASTGALRSGTIAFDPVLPVAKQQAIADLPMGMLMKIPLMLDGERFGLKPFEDLLCEQASNQDIYFLAFPFDFNLMIGFVGGNFGWEMSAAGRNIAVDFATGALKRMFGNEAGKHVVKGEVSRWASNPWVRGAYSAARPGRTTARRELERPVANRLFFAGEAFGREFAQTCGGASLSGQRTARDVLKALG
ncbi:MAG TPA: NAD(P)/FAD-dependent oxidoreductase [Xanthobacteraceae bacterium]|nr:NAD(P)/FAD-dependent oxidoreductase [Xanthobacteraceae bacterium]